jgi:thioredoxin reductase
MTVERCDVAIIGAGPAGLTAALVLGRMRRRVVVIDADDPAHAVSEGVHGFLGHDGVAPAELRRIGREQLRPYEDVAVHAGDAKNVERADDGFLVEAGAGKTHARIVLLATGVRYVTPAIDGIDEVWARGAFHCPYCHGWEVRGERLAALGAGAAHLALVLRSLSDDVVVLADGDRPEGEEAEQLRRARIEVAEQPVARLEAENGRLARIVFADGSSDERTGLFFAPSFAASPLAERLGCELDDAGTIMVDDDGRTSVPGMFAAGDAALKKKAVSLAAASGARAAFAINVELATT